MKLIRIHPRDNVAVALEDLSQGEVLSIDGQDLTAAEAIQRGHKLALGPIPAGSPVMKYGCAIGLAKEDIAPGQWVHVHNVRTGLSEEGGVPLLPQNLRPAPGEPPDFSGLPPARRPGGHPQRAVDYPHRGLCQQHRPTAGPGEPAPGLRERGGAVHLPHPFGCSQMGDDHAQTRKLLAALTRHPNAGGVLVLGLGCENLTMDQFKEELGEWDSERVKFLVCQEAPDEVEAGSALLAELAGYAGAFQREELPASELVVGMKCGGSDGLLGITANPAVGRFSDRLIALGGAPPSSPRYPRCSGPRASYSSGARTRPSLTRP